MQNHFLYNAKSFFKMNIYKQDLKLKVDWLPGASWDGHPYKLVCLITLTIDHKVQSIQAENKYVM